MEWYRCRDEAVKEKHSVNTLSFRLSRKLDSLIGSHEGWFLFLGKHTLLIYNLTSDPEKFDT